MRPGGAFIAGAPPYNPPTNVGARPGAGYVPVLLDNASPTTLGWAYEQTPVSVAQANTVLLGVPIALPYAALLLGFSIRRNLAPTAAQFLDVGLYRMTDHASKPVAADLAAPIIAIPFDAIDDTTEPSRQLLPDPVPLAPGWYWLAWKPWRTGGTTSATFFRGARAPAQQLMVYGTFLAEADRLAVALPAGAVSVAIGAAISVPLWNLVVA